MIRTLLALLLLMPMADAEPGEKRGPREAKVEVRKKGRGRSEGKTRGPHLADQFLRQGNYRAAVAAYTKELASDPEAIAAHVGMGRALARLGRCEAALEHLWPYVGTRPFGVEAALAAGNCSSQLGLDEDALTFAELGVAADPTSARMLTQYAVELDRVGRYAERDAVLDDLVVVRPERDASNYARAVLALRRGDIDALDALMFTWERGERGETERIWLRAQAWLDLDHPQGTLDELGNVARLRRGTFARQLRAEATRRIGDAEGALAILDGMRGKPPESLDYDSLRARILVDLGRVGEARALLGEYPEATDADYWGARWYVAQAEGDAAGATAAAARYEQVVDSPLRLLPHLRPITQRPS